MSYRKSPPIRPSLIYEGSVGEGRLQGSYTSSMVLLVKYSLIEEPTSMRFLYTRRHASPSVYHASPHLCKPFSASEFQLESYS